MSTLPPALAVVILAGGKSKRMGADKRFELLNGIPLLEHVVKIATQVALDPTNKSAACEIVVVGGVNEPRLDFLDRYPGITWRCDEHSDRGPLEGIRVGLKHLDQTVGKNGSENSLAFVTGCDHPLLVPQVCARMAQSISHNDAVCLSHQDIRNPIPAVYRTKVWQKIDQLFEQNRLAIHQLLDEIKSVQVDTESIKDIDPCLNSLLNINRPSDLESINLEFNSRQDKNQDD